MPAHLYPLIANCGTSGRQVEVLGSYFTRSYLTRSYLTRSYFTGRQVEVLGDVTGGTSKKEAEIRRSEILEVMIPPF